MVCFSTDLPEEAFTGPPAYHNVLAGARWGRLLLRVF